MRILLIHASHLDSRGNPLKTERSWIHGVALPLLAACTPGKAEVHLVNDSVQNIPYAADWDLVGISCMGVSLYRALQIAARFRALHCRVVLGGRVLNDIREPVAGQVDALVLGEAESTWPEVVADAARRNLKPVYGSPDTLTDMSRLPEPRYDLIDRRRHGLFYPVEASRGCPNHCDFCIVAGWSHYRHRPRPVTHVVRDLQALRRLRIKGAVFLDDNLTANRDYALELFAAIRPLQMPWISQLSTTILRDTVLLEAAAQAGCVGASIGFETINQENLAQAGKNFNRVEQYAEGLEYMRRLGIVGAPLIVIGFEYDTGQSLDALVDFLKKVPVALPLLNILTPVPGSGFYERLKKEGRLLDREFRDYNLSHAVFQPALITPAALEQKLWELYGKLYSWPAILGRMRKVSGSLLRRVVCFFMNATLHDLVKKRILPGSV